MKEEIKKFWANKNLIIGILFTLLVITTTALICSHHDERSRFKSERFNGYGDRDFNMMNTGRGNYQGQQYRNTQDNYPQGMMNGQSGGQPQTDQVENMQNRMLEYIQGKPTTNTQVQATPQAPNQLQTQ